MKHKRNFVAKNNFNRAAVYADRKRKMKSGEVKHKKNLTGC